MHPETLPTTFHNMLYGKEIYLCLSFSRIAEKYGNAYMYKSKTHFKGV